MVNKPFWFYDINLDLISVFLFNGENIYNQMAYTVYKFYLYNIKFQLYFNQSFFLLIYLIMTPYVIHLKTCVMLY